MNWWGVEAEVVYWESHALNRTIKKWRNKLATATAEAVLQSFFQSYMESSHPEETYPYDQNTIVMANMGFYQKQWKLSNWYKLKIILSIGSGVMVF